MSNDREYVIPLDEERMNELQVYFKDINLRIDLAEEIDKLQKENIKYKEILDKIKPMLKELNTKLKDILNIGIDIKEIGDILELLEEIE